MADDKHGDRTDEGDADGTDRGDRLRKEYVGSAVKAAHQRRYQPAAGGAWAATPAAVPATGSVTRSVTSRGTVAGRVMAR